MFMISRNGIVYMFNEHVVSTHYTQISKTHDRYTANMTNRQSTLVAVSDDLYYFFELKVCISIKVVQERIQYFMTEDIVTLHEREREREREMT